MCDDFFFLRKRKQSADRNGCCNRLKIRRHEQNGQPYPMNDTASCLPLNNSTCAEQTNEQNTTKTLLVARTSPGVKVLFCVIYSVISMAIVLGNIIVISVFLQKRKLRSRTAYFLVSLALSDIIVGSVGVPSFIYILANSVEFPSFVYILWNTIDVFGATASIWHLMMISIERFYAIRWPFLHRISSKKPYLCLVSLVWGVSATLCCITVKVASSWRNYTLFVSVISFLWPLTVISCCLCSHVHHCIKECFSEPSPSPWRGKRSAHC